MKLLKILKYMLYAAILAAVTLAVLYLPGVYFQHYQYEMVTEDLEQHSYEGLEQHNVNFWQLYLMVKHNKYINVENYTRDSSVEELNLEKDAFYLAMIEKVFKKYLKITENKAEILENNPIFENEIPVDTSISENVVFRNYIEDWLQQKKEWQVPYANLLKYTDIIDSKVVNVQLYSLMLEIEYTGTFIELLFNPETEIFYNINICDKRYALDMINPDVLCRELYAYYCYYYKNEENQEEMSMTEFGDIISMMDIQVEAGRIAFYILQ